MSSSIKPPGGSCEGLGNYSHQVGARRIRDTHKQNKQSQMWRKPNTARHLPRRCGGPKEVPLPAREDRLLGEMAVELSTKYVSHRELWRERHSNWREEHMQKVQAQRKARSPWRRGKV
jgi:hypothetical protein